MEKNIVKKPHGKMTSKEGPIIKPISETKIMTKYQVIDLQELENFVLEGKSISYIARYFKVGRDTIRKYIRKYKFVSKRELAISTAIKSKKEIYCRLYLKLNSVRKIANAHHTSPAKVKAALLEYGIEILESGKFTKVKHHVLDNDYYVPLSDYLYEVIIGQLLGDGCIGLQMKGIKDYIRDLSADVYYRKRSFLRSLQEQDIELINKIIVSKFNDAREFVSYTPTAQFRIHVSIALFEWIVYLSSLFIDEGYISNVFIHDKAKKTSLFDETTGFESSSSVQLYELYSEWYPENKKIIPDNLKITPNILLHWYLGDGSINKSDFYLSAESFTGPEVQNLSQILRRDVGIECWPQHRRDGFVIVISLKKDNLKIFFNYLEKANGTALQIAKRVFGWKFDVGYRYHDFLKDKHLI